MYLDAMYEYCDATTILLEATVLFAAVYFYKSRRPKNFPPGPAGLPVVGMAPFLGTNAGETFRKLKGKYGPVMSVQMGREDWVVLNDYNTINEALVKKGTIFSGRPSNFLFDMFTQGYGLAMTDYGSTWKTLRKFGLATLRGFGVGKKGMEENVVEETSYLLDHLTTQTEDSLRTKITLSVSNIISRVVFGSRFSYEDERFRKLVKILNNFFQDSYETRLIGLMVFAPALRHIPPFRGALKTATDEITAFFEIFKEFIEEHRSTFDNNDVRDFIDAFLKEMDERGEGDPSFCDPQLLQYIRDLFEAGTGTTSTTLMWSILAFAHYPECQEKIATEIADVIGDGVPSMKHRDEMPYTCAFIQEIMRHKTLLPLSVFHKTNEECTLGEYTIPKNTTVAPNIWSVHFDPDLFENPEEFHPERFLDTDGKFIRSNHVIPFSVGPRHCLGEQLARVEIFVFITSLLQKLRVAKDPEKPLPSFEDGNFNMLTYESEDYEVIFEKR